MLELDIDIIKNALLLFSDFWYTPGNFMDMQQYVAVTVAGYINIMCAATQVNGANLHND